jgi:hypothetical protein
MAEGVRLDVVKLELDGSGRGTLTLRVAMLAEYKAALAHLTSDPMLLDPSSSRWRRLDLVGSPPAQWLTFPAEVALTVVERDLPEDAATERMVLANGKLQARRYVDVVSFDPPSEGGDQGLLRLQCETKDDYRDIRRLVDEEHGSALLPWGGARYYVHRIDDDARPGQPFLQNVSIRLEWRYRPRSLRGSASSAGRRGRRSPRCR